MTFRKGQKPWNKGKKVGESHPQMGFQKGNTKWNNSNTRSTQFKQGSRPSPSTEFKKGHSPWNKGKEWLEMRGANNPAWVEDREKVAKNNRSKDEYDNDVTYKIWMRQIKNRDGWQCKIDNFDCSGSKYAHHILNWVDYPELRYELNNGITLCHAHHPRGRAKEKRMIPLFRELLSVSKVGL